MKGKVIQLQQRGNADGRQENNNPVMEARAVPAGSMQEVERILWRATGRAPTVLRERLASIARQGERVCPALFLLIASPEEVVSPQTCRLAASLEALHLALETHKSIDAVGINQQKEAILCGDFFFGLSLTLAGSQPVFIQGMSEVITRFAATAINMPERATEIPDHREYLQKICDGHASIVALSCSLGAAHGGLKPRQNEILSYYGLYLGIGLQLKHEIVNFRMELHEKKLFYRVCLPLIYTLGRSPLRNKLTRMMNGSISNREYEILIKEIDRVDPWLYTEQIIGNCFSKAHQFVELLHESIDSGISRALKSFLC